MKLNSIAAKDQATWLGEESTAQDRTFARRMIFFWRAHPLQGLAEAWVLGLLILAASTRLEGAVEPFVFNSIVFFLCGASGMWAVLRIRLPRGNWLHQAVKELLTAAGVSAVMLGGMNLAASVLGWDAPWRLASWDWTVVDVLLFATGAGYLLSRIAVRLWLVWDGLRRRRMLWALTHAHLMVVVMVTVVATAGLFLIAPYSTTVDQAMQRTNDPLAALITRLLLTIFPAVSLATVFMALALAIVLPPSAIFSYWVARRTTRRLEALTRATNALRDGDYQARVIIQGEDEVARLQANFNVMAEKLETALKDLQAQRDTVARVLETRRELVANVSHELRTPVATLCTAIETSLDAWQDAPSPALRHDLEVMDAEIRRLGRLIDDLFTLSRAETGSLSLACCPLDLAPLIHQVVDAFAPLAWSSARVETITELPADLPWVNADTLRLQQVLLNLLRNAARHTQPGGIIAVMAAAEDATVRIEIRDTGEGIAAEDLPHIWERFYRGKNASEDQADSAGLGLALVKELSEAMRGSVAVESTPGQGSCFTVRLPKATHD